MIFDIPYIIEELSAGMTLKAGTVIATGTPSGVALGMEFPAGGQLDLLGLTGIGLLMGIFGAGIVYWNSGET